MQGTRILLVATLLLTSVFVGYGDQIGEQMNTWNAEETDETDDGIIIDSISIETDESDSRIEDCSVVDSLGSERAH